MDGFIPLLVETEGVIDIFGVILGNGDFVGVLVVLITLGKWEGTTLGLVLGKELFIKDG